MMNRIVGVCRFAFLGKGDWIGMTSPAVARDQARLERQARHLFEDQRMRLRLHTLEHITLAGLKAQSDQDFDFVILGSTRMPRKWQEALRAVAATLPQARVVFSDATHTEDALRPILTAVKQETGANALQFRLDDDDAVGISFIATLRQNAQRLRGLPRFALSFPRGLSVMTYDGQPPSFWRTWRPFVGAGVAARLMVAGRSIYAVNHFELPRNLFSCLDPSITGHLVLRWDQGDTAREGTPRHPWGYEPLTRPEFDAEVADSFPFLAGFDWSSLRRPA